MRVLILHRLQACTALEKVEAQLGMQYAAAWQKGRPRDASTLLVDQTGVARYADFMAWALAQAADLLMFPAPLAPLCQSCWVIGI